MRTLTKIIVHCSYSEWGTLEEIDRWHEKRNFTPAFDINRDKNLYIGYHYIVLNPFTTYRQVLNRLSSEYQQRLNSSSNTDGRVVEARPLSAEGCHVKRNNDYSIGVCYIGITPTAMQTISLISLCLNLIQKFPLIKVEDVVGHYELDEQKTCPNFDMNAFRGYLCSMGGLKYG